MKRHVLVGGLAAVLLLLLWSGGLRHASVEVPSGVRYLILMIGDGMGANHVEAAEHYAGRAAPYSSWPRTWSATYASRGSYDPRLAWSDFDYPTEGATDSAAAATAMYTGLKTSVGRISVSADASERLLTITEKARAAGLSAGALTTVEASDATPAAWMAHNDRRSDGFAIADEGLWGDPLATGGPSDSQYYDGSHGLTIPPLDVLIGAGHPGWYGGHFLNAAIRDKLAAESGWPGAFVFLEREKGRTDAGERLLSLAARPGVRRLAGLYGGDRGHLEYALADGSGASPENPTLAEMTRAALDVLDRNPRGFILLVEGGSIDLGSHDNDMNVVLGEVLGFEAAVQAVIDWVDDPDNDSTWDNTLVLVTADHETGYLTAGPEVFPDRPLGPVDRRTLALEKRVAGTGLRASWDDADANGRIDPGEKVYWSWNTTGHSNSLVPLAARGRGSHLLGFFSTARDPVRGSYLQNTDVFRILDWVLRARGAARPAGPSPEP
jgi:alkaline phosphatase